MATSTGFCYIGAASNTRSAVRLTDQTVRAAPSRSPMTSTTPETRAAATGSTQWTFLTNHAHVLLAIARDHDVRLREIASQVGITERAVQKIIAELEESGALTKSRDGRRNHYEVNADVSLRHPMESHRTLSALVQMVLGVPHSSSHIHKPGL